MTGGLIFFLVLTIIYFTIKYYVTTPSTTNLISGAYYLLVIGFMFYVNSNTIKATCGTQNTGTALLYTLVPWFLLFGVLNILLIMFPGWKQPFSNTFGYLATRIAGVRDLLMNDILKSPSSGSGIAKTVNNIYSDPSLFINEMTPTNFDTFWSKMTPLFKTGIPPATKQALYNMVRLKDIVSEAIWFLLGGVYTIMVSSNAILASQCNTSAAKMKQRRAAYEQQVAKEESEKPKQKTYTVRD